MYGDIAIFFKFLWGSSIIVGIPKIFIVNWILKMNLQCSTGQIAAKEIYQTYQF